jgi:choline kinase
MKVGMLAAGVGGRVGGGEPTPPKALLRFNGTTLLERHLDILAHLGLSDLTLVVGHQADAIKAELAALGARERARTCFNPRYRASSLLSLSMLRDVLTAGEPVLYMDADVLYGWRLLERLPCVTPRELHPDRPGRRPGHGMAGRADAQLPDRRLRQGREPR